MGNRGDVRATRPWNSLDALRPVEPPHTCDPPSVMEVCVACTRDNCNGDCQERRRAARSASKGTGAGIQKNIRMEDVAAAYEKGKPAGKTLDEIGRELGIAKSTVRYWLRKAGIK